MGRRRHRGLVRGQSRAIPARGHDDNTYHALHGDMRDALHDVLHGLRDVLHGLDDQGLAHWLRSEETKRRPR